MREKGYDIKWIGDFAPGISDKDVYKIAQEDNRIILTDDKDFGELAVRFKLNIVGVILLRISSKKKELRKESVFELLEKFPGKLKKHMVVIDSEKFRYGKKSFGTKKGERPENFKRIKCEKKQLVY